MDRLISKNDIARHFDVTPRAVDNWRANGLLPAPMKLGATPQGRVRWRAHVIADLEAVFGGPAPKRRGAAQAAQP